VILSQLLDERSDARAPDGSGKIMAGLTCRQSPSPAGGSVICVRLTDRSRPFNAPATRCGVSASDDREQSEIKAQVPDPMRELTER
jgi:hypothetical protein